MYFRFLYVLLLVISFNNNLFAERRLNVIPQPAKVSFGVGEFRLDGTTLLIIPGYLQLNEEAELLNEAIRAGGGWTLVLGQAEPASNWIRLMVDPTVDVVSDEGYVLTITQGSVEVRGKSRAGVFYGVQTLVQLMADSQFKCSQGGCWKLPVVKIQDEPAFCYRGLMLDVSRHFYPIEFVRKCIDLMASYKLNTFHWHLTDAGGWRFEMKQFPELTSVAAWRTQEGWLAWWRDRDRKYSHAGNTAAYGGFYTQKQIKDLVAYAAARHIEVIPEIEMPGHSEEVLAVYPELACSGRPYTQGEFCAGNEKTFEFIEKVLVEVMELFPSKYIHVGGDEASKRAWSKCPKCQSRMKQENLKNEKELQSYFIHRIERFISSKGRKMIGWDEILEGGLAPNATVMSWRGEKGGVETVKSGHDVVMTPGAFCYFDGYQADPETQPYSIGGFLPYLKVYSYYPVPEEITQEEAKHVLGAQANLWTEYISTKEHVEYMIFPRLLALSEVVWTPRELKNAEDFKRRINRHIGLLQEKGVNVFTLSDRVDILTTVDTEGKRIKVKLDAERYMPEIRYTLDETSPDSRSPLYTEPFYVQDSAKLKIAIFRDGKASAQMTSARLDYHRGIGKKVIYKNRFSSSYPASGGQSLTDGYKGGLTYSDGRWQGFLKNVDVTVDMGKVMDLSYVETRFMQLTGPGVYMPEWVKVSVSNDGVNFREIGIVRNDVSKEDEKLRIKDFGVRMDTKARYVRLFAKKYSGFMFLDEIVVY